MVFFYLADVVLKSPPTKMSQITARHAYTAQNVDELSFKKRDVLVLLDKKGNKGWWMAKNVMGSQGLVPSNYFDPPAQTAADDSADFDAKVSWSQTLPQVSKPKSVVAAAPAQEKKVAEKPAAATAAVSQSVDSFGLDAWAKEMEALLLSVPAPLGERKTQVEPKPEAKKKEETRKEEVQSKPLEPQPPKKEEKIVEQQQKKVVVVEQQAKAAEPAPASNNDEWIVWMQRAIQAEQDIKDLVSAAESDRRSFEQRLEEANAKAVQFQDQVSQMIDQVNRERVETEARHKQELASALAKAERHRDETLDAASKNQVAELRIALEKAQRERDELQSSVEADVAQCAALLERERAALVSAVEQATEAGLRLDEALERNERERSDHAAALTLEQMARQQAEQQVAELRLQIQQLQQQQQQQQKQTASAPSDELLQKLATETHLKEALLLENGMLKQQLALAKSKIESSATSSSPSASSLLASSAPPTVPRETEVPLRSKVSTTSASASTAEVSAELARQRLLRQKVSPQEDKVSAVVSRLSQDLGKGSAVAGSTSSSSSSGGGDGSGTVSRSRANEILLRAKALAAKTKGELEQNK